MEDHVSPLSSSIGGIENLAREENPVGAEQYLLHQQRSGLSLSGAPGETASSQAPPSLPTVLKDQREGQGGNSPQSNTQGRATEGRWLPGPRPPGPAGGAPQSVPPTSFLLGPGATFTHCFPHSSGQTPVPAGSIPHGSVHTLRPPGHRPAAEGR